MGTNTQPVQILIIRHGEKVGDPKKNNDGGRHLSVQGSARAAALPSLFGPAQPQLSCKFDHKAAEFIGSYRQIPLKGKASRFSTPNYIFATQISKHSKRPIETVTPLAMAMNLPINDGFTDNDADIQKMTNAILNDYPGSVILICWHHCKIADIARALGVSRPPKSDGKVFDRVWQITFPKGKASLKDMPQMLLFGDSKS